MSRRPLRDLFHVGALALIVGGAVWGGATAARLISLMRAGWAP